MTLAISAAAQKGIDFILGKVKIDTVPQDIQEELALKAA